MAFVGAAEQTPVAEIVCSNDPDEYCDGYRSLSASSEQAVKESEEEPMAGHRIRIFALAGAFAAASISAASSAMAANYDGYWSLVAQTTDGHCGVTQWDVAISGGQLHYPGGSFKGAPVGLAGAVSPSGRIQVNVAAGPRAATGVGRLGRVQGNGRWAGQGPSGTCSGVWTARRVQSPTASAQPGYSAYASGAQTPTTYRTGPYWSESYWGAEPPSFRTPYR
jgi:hypothetical protein